MAIWISLNWNHTASFTLTHGHSIKQRSSSMDHRASWVSLGSDDYVSLPQPLACRAKQGVSPAHISIGCLGASALVLPPLLLIVLRREEGNKNVKIIDHVTPRVYQSWNWLILLISLRCYLGNLNSGGTGSCVLTQKDRTRGSDLEGFLHKHKAICLK